MAATAAGTSQQITEALYGRAQVSSVMMLSTDSAQHSAATAHGRKPAAASASAAAIADLHPSACDVQLCRVCAPLHGK